MQRLHQDDATGLYLSQGDWDHLKIPMEFKGAPKKPTSIGWVDPRQVLGELIDETVFPRAAVDNLKKRLGPYGEACQLDQEPTPLGGGIIKGSWIRIWRWSQLQPGYIEAVLPAGTVYRFDPWATLRFCTVDLAMTEEEIGVKKKKNDPDWTVFLAVSVLPTPQGPVVCALDLMRFRTEGTNTLVQLGNMHRTWRFSMIAVENVMEKMWYQQAKAAPYRLPVRPITTKKTDEAVYVIDSDKISRALAAVPLISDGRFFIPEHAAWASTFLQEVSAFDNGSHDDQVDVLCYAVAIAERYKNTAPPPDPDAPIAPEREGKRVQEDGPTDMLSGFKSSGDLQGWQSSR